MRAISSYFLHSQADPQDFERLLMAKPLLTVRDFRTELSGEVVDTGELYPRLTLHEMRKA